MLRKRLGGRLSRGAGVRVPHVRVVDARRLLAAVAHLNRDVHLKWTNFHASRSFRISVEARNRQQVDYNAETKCL